MGDVVPASREGILHGGPRGMGRGGKIGWAVPIL